MKRNRHTYGTLFLRPVLSFLLHPDPYAIWESVEEKIQELSACSVPHQMQGKGSKSLPLLSRSLPWAHESEGYTHSPFNDGPPFSWVLFGGNLHCSSVARCQAQTCNAICCVQSCYLTSKPRILNGVILIRFTSRQPVSAELMVFVNAKLHG